MKPEPVSPLTFAVTVYTVAHGGETWAWVCRAGDELELITTILLQLKDGTVPPCVGESMAAAMGGDGT